MQFALGDVQLAEDVAILTAQRGERMNSMSRFMPAPRRRFKKRPLSHELPQIGCLASQNAVVNLLHDARIHICINESER